MLNRVVSWFAPMPASATDDDARVGRVLVHFTLIVLAIQALAVLVPVYPGPLSRRLSLAGLFTGASLLTLWLVRRGRVRAGSTMMTLGMWSLLTYIAVTGHGILGQAFPAYVATILVASLLGGSASGLVVLLLSMTSGLAMAIAAARGWHPGGTPTTPFQVWIINSIVFGSCWLAVRVATTTITDALRRAQQELAERRQAEAALLESDKRFRQLAEATSEGIGISDEGRIIDANRVLARMLGFDRESDIIGRRVDEFVAPAARAMVAQHDAEQSEESYQHVAMRLDGTRFPVEVRARTVPYKGRSVRVAAIRDITERRLTDDLLMTIARGVASETGESFFRTLVEHLARGLGVDYALAGRLSEDGRRVETIAFFSTGRVADNFVYELAHSPCATALEHATVVYGADVQRHFPEDEDLKRLEVDAYAGAALAAGDGRPAGVLAVMHRRPFENARQVESILRIYAVRAAAELDRSRTELERAALEDRLRQSQKLETIGQLAGGIAHDFNNLLSPILGYSEMMLEELHEGDPRHRQLEFIHDAAEKAAGLTRQLLSFGRKQMLEMQPLDLNRVVTEFARILRRTIRENVEIKVEARAAHPTFAGDLSQIEQILMNLAVNAQDAMPAGGRILIATRDADAEPGALAPPDDLAPGRYVVLSVSDTGTGMDERTRARIFEPFFTTKEKGRGTGLGLATVYGIVQQHRGGVEVQSAPGRGSTFRVFLPVQPAAGAPAVDEPRARGRGCGTIAVVEDDEMVRGLTCAILRQRGYDVIEMDGPEACLRQTVEGVCTADLLVTDVVMPGMDGKQLYNRLLARCPGLKVLFISGHAHDVLANHGVGESGLQFIQKPFSADGLVAKVQEVLGG